jgi:hypothetical protein
VSFTAAMLQDEVDVVRGIDSTRPIITTTYNSSHVNLDIQNQSPLAWLYRLIPGPHGVGHPEQALDIGDALGLDVYVATPSTVPSTNSSTTASDEPDVFTRIGWKSDALRYWNEVASGKGKDMWITEMQAMPWTGTEAFDTGDLEESAVDYRSSGASVILLWGVEDWINSPEWLDAGQRTVDLLRASPAAPGAGI